MKFAQLSIRHKLLAMVLLPLAGALPLLGLLLLWWGNVAIDRMLITKVRADLAVAQGYFERVLGEVGASTGTVAESYRLHLAVGAGDGPERRDERDEAGSGGDGVREQRDGHVPA